MAVPATGLWLRSPRAAKDPFVYGLADTPIASFPTDGPQPPILPPLDGWLFLDREKLAASFADDLPAGQAAFMADSQVRWGVETLGGTISEASWRIKSSWYLVASDNRMILPLTPRPHPPEP